MALPLVNNVAVSTLSVAAAAADGTFTVADGSAFPSPAAGQYAPVSLVDTTVSPPAVREICWVTGRAANVLTVTRQAEDAARMPSPSSLPIGTIVQNVWTAQAIADIAGAEGRLHRIMDPGVTAASLKRVTFDPIATTGSTLLTVPAGRKYVVKSLMLSNFDTVERQVSLAAGPAGNAFTLVYQMNIPSKLSVPMPMALVLNAGDVLIATSSVANVDASVSYCDLAAAELPTREFLGTTATTAAWATIFTAPAGAATEITSILIGSNNGSAQRIAMGIGGADDIFAQYTVPAGKLVTIDTPIPMAAGELLRVWQYDAASALTFCVNGFPAQS